jgi:antitoxin MazE
MVTRVLKWGNSLALRIPKSFAIDMGIKTASSVDIHMEKGKIILTPVKKERQTLKDLVAMITDNNLHSEIDFGHPVGNEIW